MTDEDHTPTERPAAKRRTRSTEFLDRVGLRHVLRSAVIMICWLACLVVFVWGETAAIARIEAAWVLLSAALWDALDDGTRRAKGRRATDR